MGNTPNKERTLLLPSSHNPCLSYGTANGNNNSICLIVRSGAIPNRLIDDILGPPTLVKDYIRTFSLEGMMILDVDNRAGHKRETVYRDIVAQNNYIQLSVVLYDVHSIPSFEAIEDLALIVAYHTNAIMIGWCGSWEHESKAPQVLYHEADEVCQRLGLSLAIMQKPEDLIQTLRRIMNGERPVVV